MKITVCITITCAILSAATSASAQTTSPATQPVEQRVIPELKFDGVGIDDVMAFLRDVAPGFSPYIARESNAASNGPLLSLHAKDMTVEQFLKFLEQAYGIKTAKVDGPINPIWVMRVPNSVSNTDRRLLRPYSLRDAIIPLTTGRNGNPDDLEKQALQDVLTLIQTALKEARVDQGVSIKVHEPTRTLLIYGSVPSHEVVDQVLQTLRASTDEVRKKADENAIFLSTELQKVISERDILQKEVARLRTEMRQAELRSGATTSPRQGS
jgi:hypothetical protein